ncbi:hypothetical protein J23TS9_32880 [Paenibacillus sp. J23TS9]|uniref:hypothetical protein n=1 Tax=Paenibacillus sp. J23TS9 TaxID=2807193 RepID=UPI001B03B949|nr:hypothetical protein [Paenibacillus sp. J23TS9]GIP28158.1 hypothetical protein J23TS9_32880 [Paenibacillus sp. J23TS9]
MENTKKAWSMILKDLKGEKKYFVWAFVYAAYMAFTFGMAVKGQMEAPEYVSPVIDGLFLLLMPMLGFYFCRRSFKYLSEDSYTQMLAYFRALPISDHVVIAYRLMQIFLAFIMNGIVFFGLMYWFAEPMRSEMSLAGYFALALTWIGYGIMMSGPYMYLEFSNHGKAYLRSTLMLLAAAVIAAVVIKICGGNMLLYSIELASRWSLLSPLMWAMLAAAAASLMFFSKITLRKLRSRDLV